MLIGAVSAISASEYLLHRLGNVRYSGQSIAMAVRTQTQEIDVAPAKKLLDCFEEYPTFSKEKREFKRDLKIIFYELYNGLNWVIEPWGCPANVVGDRAICVLSVEFHVQRLRYIKPQYYSLYRYVFDAGPNKRDIWLVLSPRGNLNICQAISVPIT